MVGHMIRKPRSLRWVLLGSVLAVGICSGTVWALAVTGSAPLSVGPNDPGIRRCQAAHAICNQAAEDQRVARNPETRPPSPNAKLIARAQAEAAARLGARTPLTPSAPDTAVTFSQLMTRAEFETATGESHNASVYPTRPVWVVAVHAPMATDGSPATPAEIMPVYSVAIDAETGQWTDACIGCAWLQGSA